MTLEPRYGKLAFGRSMQESGSRGFITSDVCHNYGSLSGCDEGCPALLDGECRNIADAIECCDVTDEERKEILVMYPNISKGES